MSTTTPPTKNSIAIDQTLHSLALELADPPLADFDAWSAVVNECHDATARATQESH